MKAAVREYTKKVVVVEIDVEEAKRLLNGVTLLNDGRVELANVIAEALEADRAEERRKEEEDVPF